MAAREGDVVFLGVKPTDLEGVAAQVDGGMKADSLIVSMLAAVPTVRIAEQMKHSHICRCMPNTPVKICQGVIPYYVTPQVPDKQKELMENLFDALGTPIHLDKEAHLDVCDSFVLYLVVTN